MMRILVTGSSGRVGTGVVGKLLEAGHEVVGLDVRKSGRVHERFFEVIGSLNNDHCVRKAATGAEVVVHLGALMSWASRDEGKLFRTNVDGTRTVLAAASGTGSKRFVFASSGEVYPENAPEFLPITEEHQLNPNSVYGLTKLIGEYLVLFHGRTSRMDTVILRFAHTQDARELLDEDSFFSGPRFFLHSRIKQQESMGNHDMAALLRRHDIGEPAHILLRNERGRPYRMHITDTLDLIEGILLAVFEPKASGEVLNLGSADPVCFGQIVPAMSKLTGYPVVEVDLPGCGVFYHTSTDKITRLLGFSTRRTFAHMLVEAGRARQARQSARNKD